MFLKVQSSSEFSVLILQHVRELKRDEKALISQCNWRSPSKGGRIGSTTRRVASVFCLYMKFLN